MSKKKIVLSENFAQKKGISILLVVLVMSVVLSISFGISSLLIQQIKMMRELGFSVNAFYAADSGIERTLDNLYIPSDLDERSVIAGAAFEVVVCNPGEVCGNVTCPAENENFCIKSAGNYLGTRRAIEIQY